VTLTDQVTVSTASYAVGAQDDPLSNQLMVKASSSDALNNPQLAVTGFGPLDASGSGTFNTDAPPASITITSADGGSTTQAASTSGTTLAPVMPVAAFTAPESVTAGQPVVMDAAPSIGDITSWTWTQLSGPPVTLTGAATSVATFTPSEAGDYVFQLVWTARVAPASRSPGRSPSRPAWRSR
jgi:hypothetical protein